MTDLAQMRDIIRHAAMRGLKLKVITKQESTIAMIHELQQSEDGKNQVGRDEQHHRSDYGGSVLCRHGIR